MENRVPEKIFDIGIIGGGIAGAAVARDAALRGLKAVLFEKGRFASGTSSKSSKLIHGGIRYLELAWDAFRKRDFAEARKNFRFVSSSLKEAQLLQRLAPRLIEPIALVVPVYRGRKRSKASVFAGCFLYGVLAFLAGSSKLPQFLWTKGQVLKRVPGLRPDGLTGGVILWDRTADDAALVRALIDSALVNGAAAFENMQVLSYRRSPQSGLFEVSAGGAVFMCRTLVNASGPWIDKVRKAGGENNGDWILPVAGAHVNLKAFIPVSVLLEASDGRVFFVIRRGDTCRAGTTERIAADPDRVEATEDEVSYLLRSLEWYFPFLKWSREDILSSDAGIRPLAKPSQPEEPSRVSREHRIARSPSGMVNAVGIKLTDHRRAAEEIVNTLLPELLPFNPRASKKSRTQATRL